MSRIKFKIRIKPVGLLSIGSIYQLFTGPKIPFIKKLSIEDGDMIYKCYIPGSSFKGALRSSACRVAEKFGFKSCGEIDISRIEESHSVIGVCDVCRLFGYPRSNAPSILNVSDFELQEQTRSSIITGIRINRSSGVVDEEALFTTEKIYNVEFLGEISLNTDDINLIGLLLISLAELRLDRFGRCSQVDLKIEDTEELEYILKDSKWIVLLDELKRWLYDEIL
ncbi:MAG: RAMP superfamily CRISPR-associated protein [Candidatus Methanomethylicia archaeon]